MKRITRFCRAAFPQLAAAAVLSCAVRSANAAAPSLRSHENAVPAQTSAATPAPRFGTIEPNKMSPLQAQATIVAERDSYYLQAARMFPATSEPAVLPLSKCRLLGHGSLGRKEIALTFDDGPHPGYTPQLLSVLKRYDVPATFFLVGQMAERAPDLVRAEVAAGDNVGNHTYHHVSLVKVTPGEAATEIDACGLVLQSITGKPVHLFRPPGGRYDPAVAEEAAEQGYTTVLWTDDPGDYASPGVEKIADRTIRTAHDGGILLLHDGVQQTIDALPQIIETLRAEGYTFVTIDKMLAEKAAAAKPLPRV